MVRIKHRYLLIDILDPEPVNLQKPAPSNPTSSTPQHLYFHPPTPETLTTSVLARTLRETVSDLFGDYGVGKLGGASSGNLIIKYLSPATSTAIIRCPRAAYRMVWAALTYLSSVPVPAASGSSSATSKKAETKRSAVFRVVRVSGTMRKAEEEAIRRARKEIGRTKQGHKDGLGFLFGKDAPDGRNKENEQANDGNDDDAVFGMDIDDDDEEEEEDEDEDED